MIDETEERGKATNRAGSNISEQEEEARGNLKMLYPTVRNLEQLAKLKSLDGIREFALTFPKGVMTPDVRLEKGTYQFHPPESWPQ